MIWNDKQPPNSVFFIAPEPICRPSGSLDLEQSLSMFLFAHVYVFSWSVVCWVVGENSPTHISGGLRLVELDDRGDRLSWFSASSRLAWFFLFVWQQQACKREVRNQNVSRGLTWQLYCNLLDESTSQVGLESEEFEEMPPLDGRNCGVTLEKA